MLSGFGDGNAVSCVVGVLQLSVSISGKFCIDGQIDKPTFFIAGELYCILYTLGGSMLGNDIGVILLGR